MSDAMKWRKTYSNIEYFSVETRHGKEFEMVDKAMHRIPAVNYNSECRHQDNMGDSVVRVTYTVEGTDDYKESVLKKVRRLSRGKPRFGFCSESSPAWTGRR